MSYFVLKVHEKLWGVNFMVCFIQTVMCIGIIIFMHENKDHTCFHAFVGSR